MTCRSPLALKATLLCLAIGVLAGCARSSELTVLPAEATPKSPTEKQVYDVPLPSATAHLTASPLASPAAKPTVTQVAPEASATMQSREAFKLTILHTNDSKGYVDPCG